MISLDKINFYKKYSGDGDLIFRLNDKKAQAIFSGNDDWTTITDLLQNIQLIKKNLCSEDFKLQTTTKIQQFVDPSAVQALWNLADKLL
jgi:hypothetical protein